MRVRNGILYVVAVGFIAVLAGGDKSNAQGLDASLKETCQKLSEDSGKEGIQYEVLSGEVLTTTILPMFLDCFDTPGGCWGGQGTFIARLKSIVEVQGDKEFFIHTKLEPRYELSKKIPYMKEGESYRFCAVKVNKFEFSNSKDVERLPKYRIDFIDTINQIEKKNSHE